MPKNVLIIESSPRKKGNSVALAARAAGALRDGGVSVETIHLQGMKIGPCLHCDGCLRKKVFCMQQDDMQMIYPKMIAADGLIFASPIYYFNFNAQMKTVVDRWYGIEQLEPNFLQNKPIGVILTFANEDVYSSGGIYAVQTFEAIFRWLHTGTVSYVYGSVSDVGDAAKKPELMEKAFQLGKKMGEAISHLGA